MKVGVELTLSENPWLGRAPRYHEIRELALAAEAAGLDSIWVYDHLLYRVDPHPPEGIWEGWTVLSALAEATGVIELGTLVSCVAFRNPAVLAKMAITLDEVSGGRLTLGLGAGWNDAEFAAFGLPLDHRYSRFAEALAVIAPLIREGRVTHHGRFHTADRCEILPRGPRPSGPPLLLAGFGPRMLDLVARHGDAWNGGYAARPDDVEPTRRALEHACIGAGRDPATIALTVELKVGYPDLAPPPARFAGAFASGSAASLAETIAEFDAAGFDHIMCSCAPTTLAALDRLAEAVSLFRSASRRDRPR